MAGFFAAGSPGATGSAQWASSPLQRCRFLPGSAGDAAFDGVEDGLAAETVGEGRGRADAGFDAVEEVLHRVGEGVLVADDVPGRPPDGVGVTGVGDVDGAESLETGRVVGQVDLQLVHLLQVEGDAAVGAVDLERVVVAPTRRQPGRLEGAGHAALETGEEGGAVVDRYLAPFGPLRGGETRTETARRLDRPLLDEGAE